MSTTPYGGSIGSPTDGARIPVQRTTVRDERSIGQLFKELQSESSTLVRQEVELAKAEVMESVRSYARSAVSMAIGGALLLAALFGVLWTINMALTALLEDAVGLENAVWLSPLILSAVIAIIGYSMVKGASNRMREESLVPRRTTETLKEEKQWLKNRHA
ncbi:MAG TPA: phage holin family protein [Longimicrobiales bacterium]|nr:phage holin family protein [Longimicrobiales bacterium]